ncbi:MAG: hypothetical protein ACR2MB_12105 [Acidimicrobiales bacterium]
MDDLPQQIRAWTDHVNRSAGAPVEAAEVLDEIRLSSRPPGSEVHRARRVLAVAATVAALVGGAALLTLRKDVPARVRTDKTAVVAPGGEAGATASLPKVDASKVIPPEILLRDCSNAKCAAQKWSDASPDTRAVKQAASQAGHDEYFACMKASGYHVSEPKTPGITFSFAGGFEIHYTDEDLSKPNFKRDDSECVKRSDDASNAVWEPYRKLYANSVSSTHD